MLGLCLLTCYGQYSNVGRLRYYVSRNGEPISPAVLQDVRFDGHWAQPSIFKVCLSLIAGRSLAIASAASCAKKASVPRVFLIALGKFSCFSEQLEASAIRNERNNC